MEECKDSTLVRISFSTDQIQQLFELTKEPVEYGGNIALDDDGRVQSIEKVRGKATQVTFARRTLVHYHSHPSAVDANALFQPPSPPDVVFLIANDWLSGSARIGIVCTTEGLYVLHMQDAATLLRSPSLHKRFALLMNWIGVHKCHGYPLWTHGESVEQYTDFCLKWTGVATRFVQWPRPGDSLDLSCRLPAPPPLAAQVSLLEECVWREIVKTFSPTTQYLSCCDVSHRDRETVNCIARILEL
jgi:hypothetical protein